MGFVQGLADLDPDVDAIFRLTQRMGVNFRSAFSRNAVEMT